MVRNFKMLMDSGIYTRVSKQVVRNATLLREREAKWEKDSKFRDDTFFKAVRIGDSVQTVFILLGICLGMCSGLAVFEHVKYYGPLVSLNMCLHG